MFEVNKSEITGAGRVGTDDVVASGESSREGVLTPEGQTWNRVIVVHNRLPFNVKHDQQGKPMVVAGSGGLVTAMAPLLQRGIGGKWVGWPGTDKDMELEEAVRAGSNGHDIGVVRLTSEEVEQYYEGYSNRILTPLFEEALDQIDFTNIDQYWSVYQSVQRKFAEKVREDLRSGDIIWIHDWHLTGVGIELLSMGVNQPMGFFLHIPFPKKEVLALLPQRNALLENLLAHDIVGFQTKVFKENFLDAIREYVPEAIIEKQSDVITLVRIGERVVRVGNFPISIDPEEFLTQVEAPETQEYVERLDRELRKDGEVQLIFNTGRLDYVKGFYEELLAFDRLLEKHPELIGKIKLFQLVIPSRESIEAYRDYKKQIVELAERINRKYKTAITGGAPTDDGVPFSAYEDMPVQQVHAHMSRSLYLAHLNVADIQSVPTKADGMNLVAKEGAVAGKSTMTQLLGKVSGAAEELGDSAILIDPSDIESFSDALYSAYSMSDADRRERKIRMAETVIANDVYGWWAKEQQPAFQEVWDARVSQN